METFLKELAQEIASRFDEPRDLCIVLPTKRAVVFFKQELAKAYNSTFWAPEFYSLGEFVEQLSGVKKEDKLLLILELYDSYLKVVKGEPEDLESFLKWAPTLLSDFAEIDRYLIEPINLFSYINEARALEYWNINGEPLTDAQKKYLHFWKLLGAIYFQFNKDLKEKKKSYAGMQFRIVAENINTIIDEFPFKKVIFAGFNALSAAEEKIVYRLIKSGLAEVFWDGDDYYINRPEQEAGTFMRRIKRKFPTIPFNWSKKHLETINKNINIVACNTDLAQTQYACEVLQKKYKSETGQKTAVVLNNEELLLPLLYNLPDNVEAANITMGYNLKLTPLASFINIWLDLWNNNRVQNTGIHYYFKNIFRLLEHPYFSFLTNEEVGQLKALKINLIKRNVIYIGRIDFEAFFPNSSFLDVLFSVSDMKSEAINNAFLKLFSLLKNAIEKVSLSDVEKSIHTEYLYSYTVILRKFGKLLEASDHLKGIENRIYKKLLNQLVGSESLSFFGEPLKGLQIMGMLETRLLDFDNVILLSVNEGVLPQGKKENSFIPYDIKQEFYLPTHTEHDAVFANHFYRLIQRASNVELVYLNGKNDFGASTEKSRFIEQIEFELPRVNKNVHIKELGYSPTPKVSDIEIEFEKSEAIIQKIINKLETGISPSAFNKFIQCPLDFYYRYILGLGEADEIEEQLQHSTFGTCVHETLEDLYKPYIGKALAVEDIEKMKPLLNGILNDKFLEYLSLSDLKSGSNLLTFEVAQQYVKNFLKQEIKTIVEAKNRKENYIVIQQEEALETVIPVDVNGININVKIRGIADRIGQLGSTVQLIDYKTGNVVSTDLSIRSWSDLAENPKKSKALQLALYGLAYLNTKETVTDFEGGIYSFRNFKSGLLTLKFKNKKVSALTMKEEIPGVVEAIVSEMLSKVHLIAHNSDSKYCNYC
jgi:hypothetical protein